MKSTIFWDIKPCSPLSVNRRFGETYRLQLQGRFQDLISSWFLAQLFTPGERAPGTNWIGGWVGPRVGLDSVEKKTCTAGNRTRAVQPAAIPTEPYGFQSN
jgi:hypothetical protein